MKQKLLNSIRLRAMMLVAVMCAAFAGQAWADKYVKITSASDLEVDAEYLLVSGTEAYSGISGNIGQHVTVTFTGDDITSISTAHVLTLGGSTGEWTLYDQTDKKYLAYTSTSTSKSNYLYQVSSNSDDGATWTFTVSESAVKMQNNYNVGRWMRYNSDRFCCYYKSGSESTTGSAVTLYKKDAASSISAPSISPIDGSTFTGTQSVTITQAESKDVYYTTDGTTPTSLSTKYTEPFNVAASLVTGEVTVKAIAIDGTTSSSVSSVTYTDTSIQPTSINWNFNNTYLGISEGTNLTGTFTKTTKGVKATIDKTSGTYPRGDAGDVRFYNNSFLKLEAPDGFEIKGVTFTSAGGWTDPTPSVGTIDTKVWSGLATEVQFNFTATSYAGSIAITLARALPYVVSFGDLNDAALEVGDEGTFSTTITPAIGGLEEDTDYEIEWSSSDDTGLAVLEDGTYEATTRGAYTVTVTATAADDESYKDASKEYDVTVTEPVVITATDIAIATGSDPVAIGATTTDGYEGTLSYESGNTSIATVDASGNVTAVAVGSTTITISASADASNYFSSASKVINVTVSSTISVAGVSLKPSTTIEMDETETLTPTFTPSTASNKNVTWESDNTEVATVDEYGEVTGVAAGTATITVTTEDGSFTATCEVTVTLPKGTEGNPYTVADIEGQATATTFGDDIYVTGYIVGSVKNNKCYKGTGDLVDTNLLLADTPDISFTEGAAVASNEDGLIPVELPTGTIRTNWGPASNAVIGYKVVLNGNANAYFGTNSIKGTSTITKVAEIVKVTSAGFATWASDSPLDFTDKDIDAYIAITKGDGTGVTFTQINKVPANTGVLLYYEGGKTEEIPVFDGTGAESTAGNKFVKGTGAAVASVVGDLHNYILNKPSEKPIGFYKAAGQTVAKNRAYIQIDESTPVKEFITLPGDDATAIAKVQDSGSKIQDSEIFNLAGQKMSKLQKGVNIVNGKKVLVK